MRLEWLAVSHRITVEQVRFQTACNFKSLKYIAIYRWPDFGARIILKLVYAFWNCSGFLYCIIGNNVAKIRLSPLAAMRMGVSASIRTASRGYYAVT